MANKMNKYILGFLILVVLTASVYVMLPNKIRIDVGETNTQYRVYENGSWVLAGTEYTKLYDGTALMRANKRIVNYTIDGNQSTIYRYAFFKDNITAIDIYKFDGSRPDIELVPVSHEIKILNGQGKIFQYEINNILYDGETKNIFSPFSFGHKMKVEWQDGSYYAKVFQQKVASDKLIIKYKPKDNDESYLIRLFDPAANITVTLNSPVNNYWAPTSSVTFNCSASIVGVASLKNVSLFNNISGSWNSVANYSFDSIYNLSDTREVTDGTQDEAWNWSAKTIDVDGTITNFSMEIKTGTGIWAANNKYRLTLNYISGSSTYGQWDTTSTSYVNVTYTNPNPSLVIDNISVDLYWGQGAVTQPYARGVFSISNRTNLTTQTFIKTINNTTLWTCQACDTDNDCNFATTNRTVYLDQQAPLVNITYPIATNYTTNISTLLYGSSDENPDKCWYSTNNGVSNSTVVSFGTNFSNVVSNEGWNNWTVYCNDTGSRENSSMVTFFKDSIYPQISYSANSDASNSSGNFTTKNWIFINVSVVETNIKNVTFWTWTSLNNSFNKTTYTNNASSYYLNQTGLSNNIYFWSVTVCDISNNCNTTSTRYYGKESVNLSINGLYLNQNSEIGTNLNITATSTYDEIFIDVNHPAYGINYSSGTWSTTFNLVIDWFRRITFNNSLTSNKLNYSGTENFNVYFNAHQYDEVVSMAFNISGENNPTNIQINKSNTTGIDRYYDGILTGSNIYLNHNEDNETYKNFTYEFITVKNIYFQIDENSSNIYVLFNLTGLSYGLEYYESYSDSFSDWVDIDTDLTSAKLDLSGLVISTNASKQYSNYDSYDGSINDSLWGKAVSSSSTGSNDETNNYIQSNLSYGSGATFSNHLAYVYTNNYTFMNLWSSDELKFRVVSDYDAEEGGGDSVDGNSKIYLSTRNAAGLMWTSSHLDNSDNDGAETSDADLNFTVNRYNETSWKVNISGVETSSVNDYGGCDQTGSAKPATGVWNWTSGIWNITCSSPSYGGPWSGSLNNSFYKVASYDTTTILFSESVANKEAAAILTNMRTMLYPINKSLYYVTNSSVYSDSIYDASSNITYATFDAGGYNGPNSSTYLYLSADGGNNWESVTDNAQHTFINSGQNLKYRVDFNTTNPGYNVLVNYFNKANITIPKGYPGDISIDFGADGINDYTFTGSLNSTNSPITVNISNPDISDSSFVPGYPHLLRVPLEITSSSVGQLNLNAINITYNPNPIYLNVTAISNYLSSVSGMSSFLINIMATNGNITINDIKYDYKGGNDTIGILAHNADYSINKSLNITFYYSSFYKNLPYTWINKIFFMPKTNSSKNVSAYGQTTTIPIYNITTTNYGRNINMSIKVNESFSCLNITWNSNSTKPSGNKINTTWQKIGSNLAYLNNTKIWLWADFDNCNASNQLILQPSLLVEGYCIDCIWS